MENAVEALKIAFAMMMFVLALSLSISSFSRASSAIDAITNMRDRETEYTYVQPTEELTRTVGIETVVSSMYRAFEENITIYFWKSDETPFSLYYDTETTGKRKTDDSGKDIEMTSIDLSNEGFATKEEAQEHLDIILGGEDVLNAKSEYMKKKYENKLIHTIGLYEVLNDAKFTEYLGEFYQGEGASKIKKRVITYKIESL